MNSPLGPLTVASTDRGIASIQFGAHLPHGVEPDSDTSLSALEQLTEYFEGKRTDFDVDFDIQGTPFQLSVWKELRRIPYGETRTYGEIAEAIGKPGAARAVGMANHDNPVAVMIPCHRVVGADGSLTGYAAGIDVKARLLSIERRTTLFT